MSVEAERETLERKDRDELGKIAGALGGKVTSRTRKAEIIDQILELTGVTGDGSSDQAAESSGSSSRGGDGSGGTDQQGDAATPAATGGQNATGQRSVSQKRGNQKNDGQKRDGQKNDGPKSGDQQAGSQKSGKSDDRGKADERESNGDTKSDDARDKNDSDRDNGSGDDGEAGRRRRRRGRNREGGQPQDEFTGEPIPVVGCLDLRDDGYGFLRVDGLLPSKDDCYVSVKQVRQFGLRKGDIVAGGSRPAFRNEKNPAILRIDTVNDVALEPGTERPLFEDLTPVFASETVSVVMEDEPDDTTTRSIELLAPIGKGSRALVAAPPRTGKTTLLQRLARSIEVNEPDVKLIVVLLDEKPEEVTEMERLVAAGSVYGSAFDADPDDHVAVLELALARARRMAEAGDDVVVLFDGLTRLARADHASGHGNQSNNRTLGGLDVNAIQTAKRAFGAGRKLEEAGSITMVATATVDTDSDIDEAVHDAVLGAATTQIRLDRFAAERRSFPALDVGRTSTRHEELLVGDEGTEQREALRRLLAAKPDGEDAGDADGLGTLLSRLRDTKSNDDVLEAAAKEERSR
ncbi:MAG: transcription termination factor Rho [Acidimicrobiales bacterium]|nr:transcription termination factor Rho [Acidimicrobiales bacterium]